VAAVSLIGFSWLMEDAGAEGAVSHLEATFTSPLVRGGVLIAAVLLALFLPAVAVHQFWNRCVTDIFSLRAVTFTEGYAFSTILLILLL
jgi:hypothetical protein